MATIRVPFAHNPLRVIMSAACTVSVELPLYRCFEEVTLWEEFVHKHFLDRLIQTQKKE